ncbi:MAG: HlyD family secretion protein [Kordia sp.]|nr:MAG: HlyD family secretion protein [Kordia sp.]
MPNNTDNFNLRSEEVQDILTAVPNWTVRSGSALLCVVIALFLFMSWFIKYPDIIEAQATLTTENPPQKEYAKNSGKLQHLLVENNQVVSMNSYLAIIENAAKYSDVQLLKQLIDSTFVNTRTIYFPIEHAPLLFLGEIDTAYAMFENSYMLYSINNKEKPFNNKKLSHKNTSHELQIRLNTLENQQAIQKEELKFKHKDANRYQQLFNKGVVSEQEHESKQLQLLQSERNYKNTLSAISQLKEGIGNAKYDFNSERSSNIGNETMLFKNAIHAFNQLRKAVYDWEYKYVLQSNINGSVSFLNFWSTNQYVNVGDQLFTIVPQESHSFVVKLLVPVLNSGKIKIGQIVNVSLNNYPEIEYGVLKGIVTHISEVTTKEGNYIVDVSLPQKLITSYKTTLDFKHEMSGTAEIITDDLRLTERFLGRLKNVLND